MRRSSLFLSLLLPATAMAGYEFDVRAMPNPKEKPMSVEQKLVQLVQRRKSSGQITTASELEDFRKQFKNEEQPADGRYRARVAAGKWGREASFSVLDHGKERCQWISREFGSLVVVNNPGLGFTLAKDSRLNVLFTYLLTGYLYPGARQVGPAEDSGRTVHYEVRTARQEDGSNAGERFALHWADSGRSRLLSASAFGQLPKPAANGPGDTEWRETQRWKVEKPGSAGGPLVSEGDLLEVAGLHPNPAHFRLRRRIADPSVPYDPLASIPAGAKVRDETDGPARTFTYPWDGKRKEYPKTTPVTVPPPIEPGVGPLGFDALAALGVAGLVGGGALVALKLRRK